jgi:hypothetical protein
MKSNAHKRNTFCNDHASYEGSETDADVTQQLLLFT